MAFSPNPLSMSLSDEHVQRELWASAAASAKPAAPSPSAAQTRRMRRGRSLLELTVDDLLKKRRSWREFVGGMQPLREFSVPRSLEEATYKLSENVYEFIGNYLLVALVCVGCVLYKRPAALIGIICVSLAWEWQQKHAGPRGGAAGGGGGGTPGRAGRGRGAAAEPAAPEPSGWELRVFQAKQYAVTALTWVVLIASNVVPAMGLAALVGLAAVCLHGLLRNPVPRRTRLLR